MAAKRKRKPRIPQVLWKLFEKRVRNLANTLVSLIPHPSSLSPPSCSCISSPPPSGCLRCTTGERAKLFLLRPDDPPDYRKLLTLCYVVVDVNAPPLRNFCTDNRWPQIEIVRRAIETVRYQQNRAAGNVMFIGYDQRNRSSPITELLDANVWRLLLKRVGDELMLYLLKHASIFLPLPCMTYQQVAGLPISGLVIPKFQKDKLKLQTQKKRPYDEPSGISEDSTKRARTSQDNSISVQQQTSSSCSGNIRSSNVMHHPSHPVKKYEQVVVPDVKASAGKNISSGGSNNNMLDCRKSSTFRAVTTVVEINRRPIFYCYREYSSVLPQKHVLRSSKPNYEGSKSLLQGIFGFSDEAGSKESLTCSNSNGSCQNRSTCLHHSLAKLLKILIFQTQRCNHLKLLDKHCTIPSSFEVSFHYTN
ncbi:Telomerase reverse transcriptase, partial [Linum grandiflorum]